MSYEYCDHELIDRVSPAGDDFVSCNKCGRHIVRAGDAPFDDPGCEEEDE